MKTKKEKDWYLEEAKLDVEAGDSITKEVYDLLFSELTEEEKEENTGKPLYWVEGMWINPDGTIIEE